MKIEVTPELVANLKGILAEIRPQLKFLQESERKTLDLMEQFGIADDASESETPVDSPVDSGVTDLPLKKDTPKEKERSAGAERIHLNGTSRSTKKKKQRQRLPRGYASEQTLAISEKAGRVLNSSEFQQSLNEKIEKDFPGNPHLSADANTTRKALRDLYDQDKIGRVQYGPSSNFVFYGVPRYFTEMMGRITFADERFKPDPSLLGKSKKTAYFDVPGLYESEEAPRS